MTASLLTNFAKTAAECAQGNDFFGLRPWYHYLPTENFDNDCSLKQFTFFPGERASDVPLVMLAIVDDMLRIAGVVAVAYVIVGAVQYITSQGSPEQTGRAQSTIINALIGLAIAMISIAFVSFVGNRLGG
jgi:Type IV secretion system pilin